MKKRLLVLGIESSHDDTSIALVLDYKVIFNLKISQIEIHKKYGGTVPEIASREHYQNFYILLKEIKKKSLDFFDIDYIAYTEKPGLIGSLQMGKLFAHALSVYYKKPLKPINHLDGHLYSVFLDNNQDIQYPAIGLIVSGGHTNLYYLKNSKEKTIIGQTQDDAIGEVFDKVARVLDLGFPGGPIIDKIYHENSDSNFNSYKLSVPKLKNPYDFSFSGYKTQIINYIKSNNHINKKLLATAFQKNVVDYVINTLKKAIQEFKPQTLILSGGVSANQYLRSKFMELHPNCMIPNMEYTTDNGAMIAAACIHEEKNKK